MPSPASDLPIVAPRADRSTGTAGRPTPRRGLSGFEREVVGVFVGLAQGLGLPPSYGEIYGLLFASAQPLAFADIQLRLGLSKGSVSQGLRALREIGAVVAADDAQDDRRELYEPATELRQLIGAILRGTVQPQLEQGSVRVERAARQLRAEKHDPVDAEKLLQRLDKLRTWHQKAGGILPWVAKFLG